jgi:hypothetical protein
MMDSQTKRIVRSIRQGLKRVVFSEGTKIFLNNGLEGLKDWVDYYTARHEINLPFESRYAGEFYDFVVESATRRRDITRLLRKKYT